MLVQSVNCALVKVILLLAVIRVDVEQSDVVEVEQVADVSRRWTE